MSKFKTVYKLVKEPRKFVRVLGDKKFFNWMPDEKYLKLVYWAETGEKLNLEELQTFNEKLQWLKLYDRKPEYSIYVDKYEVRKHIAKTIGKQYLIPLVGGVYKSVEEIPWDELPDKFVMKCTHGSGSNIICKNKKQLDINNAKQKLNKWMKKNWYWFGREWPYKNVKPRIMVEKYMVDESGIELKDYKIFCFNGEPKLIQVGFERYIEYKKNFYDTGWNLLDVQHNYSNDLETCIEKPSEFRKMLKLAKILSEDISFLRVDFYLINNEVFFGELTFFPASGFGRFEPKFYDDLLGDWIKLPNKAGI